MAPVKKPSAGSLSSAIWENDAVVNGKKVGILKATVENRPTGAQSTLERPGIASG